jgi:hypothetical protein
VQLPEERDYSLFHAFVESLAFLGPVIEALPLAEREVPEILKARVFRALLPKGKELLEDAF